MSASTKAQLQLPTALGGFGLTSFSTMKQVAYEASKEEFGATIVPDDFTRQGERARALLTDAMKALLDGCSSRDRARLLSCSGSGSWVAHTAHLRSTAEFRIAAQIRLHLLAVVSACKLALPLLERSRGRRIVNICSMGGRALPSSNFGR